MAEATYTWEPITVVEAAGVFEPLAIPWWVAGGEAIDLFVGRATRAHGDIDIAILRRDTHRLHALRDDWDVHIAHDGKLIPWDSGPLADDMHQFWVRKHGAKAWAFEVLLEYTDGDGWLYRRDNRVRRRVGTIGRFSSTGVPFLAPEICLLYKANRPDVERNAIDFEIAAPLLSVEARRWLREAIAIWIRRIPGSSVCIRI